MKLRVILGKPVSGISKTDNREFTYREVSFVECLNSGLPKPGGHQAKFNVFQGTPAGAVYFDQSCPTIVEGQLAKVNSLPYTASDGRVIDTRWMPSTEDCSAEVFYSSTLNKADREKWLELQAAPKVETLAP